MESVSDDFAEEPKQMKIAAEERSMDPFKLPFDIHHLICQHLTGKEVLKMSEVSPAWYTDTANSNDCMNKIKFNFFLEKGSKFENPKELIETKRQHKNVVLYWEYAGMNLLNRTKVIEKFASSVVYLEIREITNLVWEPVHLSQLKTLQFEQRYEVRPLVSPTFMNVISQSNLENLIVNGRRCEVMTNNSIFNIIKSQLSSLKMLSLDRGYPGLVFGNRNVAILHHLKLVKLKMSFDSNCRHPDISLISSISSFLKSQADTLEHLVILLDITGKTLKIALELPNLQIFETDSCYPGTEWSALPTSNSIVDFKISGFKRFVNWFQDLKKLLKQMPNLEQMTIDRLGIDCLQIIAQTAIKLEILYFENGPSDIGEKYEAIKQKPNIIVNHRIQIKPAVGQPSPFTF